LFTRGEGRSPGFGSRPPAEQKGKGGLSGGGGLEDAGGVGLVSETAQGSRRREKVGGRKHKGAYLGRTRVSVRSRERGAVDDGEMSSVMGEEQESSAATWRREKCGFAGEKKGPGCKAKYGRETKVHLLKTREGEVLFREGGIRRARGTEVGRTGRGEFSESKERMVGEGSRFFKIYKRWGDQINTDFREGGSKIVREIA